MTNQEVIAQLRRHGYRVRVQHLRYLRLSIPLLKHLGEKAQPMDAIRRLGMSKLVSPKGGAVKVEFLRPGADRSTPEDYRSGESFCCLEELFVRADGLRIALLDALVPGLSKNEREAVHIEEIAFDAAGKIASVTVEDLPV
jgi:hypothetical protein